MNPKYKLKPTDEKAFLQSKHFNDPLYIRGVFLLFTILYGLFGIIDLTYFPEIINHLIIIRFVIVIPILISVIILTYTKAFLKWNQLGISISFFIGGLGIVYMLLVNIDNIVYYGGLFMVFFSGYLLIKLRFEYAVIAGYSIFLTYVLGYILTNQTINDHFLYSSLFFLGANIIGTVGSYNLEKMNRMQYQRTLELHQANQTLLKEYHEKNKQLEQLQKSIDENLHLKKMYAENQVLTQNLREREEQYRLLTTEMQLGLALHEIMCDEKGHPIDYIFLSANDSYERITGLKKENILGKKLTEVLPEVEPYWIETFGKVALSGESIQYENYSKEIGKHFHTSAYSPKKGQFAVIVEDVSEKKIQEIKQKEHTNDLLLTQKIAHLGTWRFDVKTGKVSWSGELYQMFSINPELPPPQLDEQKKYFKESSWNLLIDALYRIRKDGTPYELELETIHTDQSNGWIWVRGEAEKDEDGNIISIIGAAQDITERKKLEEALSESNQKFVTIFEQSPVAIEFYNKQGDHLYSNEAALSLFGVINPDELKNKNLFDNPHLNEELIRKIEHFEQVSVEIEYDFEKVKTYKLYQTTKSGKIILQLSITPIVKDHEVNGYILHSEDITIERREQKEIEYLSYHDYLTDLYNRRYFVNAYHQFLRKDEFPLGLMMIDINGLKIINDAYGHIQGDIAIKTVAQVLREVFREPSIVARIGGDEFAILIPCKSEDEILSYKEKIIETTNHMSIGNIELSLAIGYEVISDPHTDIDDLLSSAENYLYRHKIAVGSSVRNRAIKAILSTLTDKYEDEKIHSERVSYFCKKIGLHMGLPKDDINILELAGMYHDIGKISIPDAILNKPARLTPEEYEIIKTHTLVGYQILKAADEYSGLAEYALSHHERWDGKGYPKGLKGDEIPLFSRIISVADSFEAMTANRPYRKGMSLEDAIKEIERCKGTQFDPDIAETFIHHQLYEE